MTKLETACCCILALPLAALIAGEIALDARGNRLFEVEALGLRVSYTGHCYILSHSPTRSDGTARFVRKVVNGVEIQVSSTTAEDIQDIIARVATIRPAGTPPKALKRGVHFSRIGTHWELQIAAWMLIIAALLPLMPVWLRLRKALIIRRRSTRGLCTACGFNLTGNVTGICSECGTPITATNAGAAAP